ncbi:hypothetical protein BJV77DRAFT_1009317 [Russula vinacea]|nr:hypothetical protein BJV77DRAFT_1009317 [Russula vinacea]
MIEILNLVATAVPLDQSGIKFQDIEKALGRLRKKVDGLQVENKSKDGEILQRLLLMIDGVTISSTGIRSKQFITGSRNSDGEDGFEKRPADKGLDREKKTDVRSESPQSFKSGFHIFFSLVSRASTDAGPSTLHRDAHTVLSDKGQSGIDPTSHSGGDRFNFCVFSVRSRFIY